MIKNLVFDMGNVLIGYDPQNMIAPFVSDPDDQRRVREAMFESPEWKLLDRGDISELQTLTAALERLPQRLWQPMRDVFRDWHRHYRVIHESTQIVRTLQANGYRTYLLSNASLRWYEYYCGYEALRILDGYVISAKERHVKPEPEIYRALFERFCLKPEECFFVDDLPVNIRGAQDCGMDGFALTHFQYDELKTRLRELGVRI